MSCGTESLSSPHGPSAAVLVGNAGLLPGQPNEETEQRKNVAEGARQSALRDELLGSHIRMASESPDFIADQIQKMDIALDNMNTSEKSAYVEACRRSPQIATDTEFRLKFLRAELFDPGLAAHRLTQYFEFIRQWFGADGLEQRISQFNLDMDDLEALSSGGLQLLQQKDGAGRSILFFRMSDSRYKSIINMVRLAHQETYSPIKFKRGIRLFGVAHGLLIKVTNFHFFLLPSSSFVRGST